jgi:hypothetical protein
MGHACCVDRAPSHGALYYFLKRSMCGCCSRCCWHARFHYLVNSGLLGFRNLSLLKRELRDNNQSDKITCFYYASLSTSRFQSLVRHHSIFFKTQVPWPLRPRWFDSSLYTSVHHSRKNKCKQFLFKKKKAISAVGSSRKGGTRFVDNISVRYMSLAFMTMLKNK